MTMSKTMEEVLKSSREADKIDREQGEQITSLITHPGWKVYIDLLNRRIQLLGDEMMRPVTSVDAAIAQEYVKGTMSGLVIARDLPSYMMHVTEQLRQTAQEDDDA